MADWNKSSKNEILITTKRPRSPLKVVFLTCAAGLLFVFLSAFRLETSSASHIVNKPIHATEYLQKCRALRLMPEENLKRTESNRFVVGTPRTLLKNATLWTGSDNGNEVLKDIDVLLDMGLIVSIGHDLSVDEVGGQDAVEVVDVTGAWVTPGIVDLHSHIGVGPSPSLNGAARDSNSIKGPIVPFLRSIDGLNTHDDAYHLAVAGGTTSALVLPGSANAIGGQAFPIKLRHTEARTPSSLLIDVPDNLHVNASVAGEDMFMREGRRIWRHIKHACGENPDRVYSNSRMDTYWAFRKAYNTAKEIRDKQDDFCAKAEAGTWTSKDEFPESLEWEALVDVLRGRVKVHTHCYEAVDLDAFVRISNEFQFPIAAFHHAHETYLVPDLLKSAYGKPPAAALFAAFMRYKRESYRGSEYAPAILASSGIKVVMKSDHPAIDSRYLLHEAQQAHYHGLPANLALASVITVPAEVMGLEGRVGHIKEGWDADLVVWDSHPLTLGATPIQVWIDGIAQLSPNVIREKKKLDRFQTPPNVPDWNKEMKTTVEYDGLPPLKFQGSKKGEGREGEDIIFTNVKSVWSRRIKDGTPMNLFDGKDDNTTTTVLTQNGRIVCLSPQLHSCSFNTAQASTTTRMIDLEGGSLSPGLTLFGPPFGLAEIDTEPTTGEGVAFGDDGDSTPGNGSGEGELLRAVDALKFGGRDELLAYKTGITTTIVSPLSIGLVSGLGTAFRNGAEGRWDEGAVRQDVTDAVHISMGGIGISGKLRRLRRLLKEGKGVWGDVVKGKRRLVVQVHNADVMASLLDLKSSLEASAASSGAKIKMTFTGAAEAHLLALAIAEAGVGVIVRPTRTFPTTWEGKDIMPGPPLTEVNQITYLLRHNITLGIGAGGLGTTPELWTGRKLRWDVGWAMLDSNGEITVEKALKMVGGDLEELLGFTEADSDSRRHARDIVAVRGGDGDVFGMEGKVVAVLVGDSVDLFE